MNRENLNNVLELHKKWLNGEKDGEHANLRGANLQGTNLRGADLREADLRGAHLQYKNLQGADLRGADLQRTHLQGAHLQGANLRGADLRGAHYYFLQCPEEGSFIGWKKCKNNLIVKLEIPANAKRSSATSRQCRASEAYVIAIYSGENEVKEAVSVHYSKFIYKLGETVKVDNFDEDRFNECSAGIHFFITRQEAENY